MSVNIKKKDRRLKRLFINGINDQEITIERVKELTATKNTSDVSSRQVLSWAKYIEIQRSQKVQRRVKSLT